MQECREPELLVSAGGNRLRIFEYIGFERVRI